MKHMARGFSLLEMLVSVAIFAFIVIGIYYFFDTGRWMYLHSESRSNLQENGRLTIEGMEREMRMIGLGIPSGTEINSNLTWNPPVIYGTVNTIGFRGDIDSYNSLPTANIGNGDTNISVQWPQFICPDNNTILLIVQSGRKWQATNCTSKNEGAGTITIAPGAVQAFPAEETELFAPVSVFYRFSPDTDNDGICDQETATVPDFSQCVVERAEERAMAPMLTPSVNTPWRIYATNIQRFQFTYLRKTSTGLVSLTTPLGALSNSVDVIRILITAKDRAAVGKLINVANTPVEYQTADFTTDVLVRKRRY